MTQQSFEIGERDTLLHRGHGGHVAKAVRDHEPTNVSTVRQTLKENLEHTYIHSKGFVDREGTQGEVYPGRNRDHQAVAFKLTSHE